MFIIPIIGLLTLIVAWGNFRQSFDHVFAGDAENIHYPGLNIKSLQSHKFQKYIEALITQKLRMRNLFISINSQLYYSLFQKSFAENSQVIVGKNNTLFEMGYINAYCHRRPMADDELKQLSLWADKIKKLNDFFNAHGKTFIYVITPSKAEYMPNAIPSRFHCPNIGIRSQVTQIKKLLDAKHVRYMDGATLMVEGTQKYGISMFPPGGTHWNWLGSTLAARSIISTINEDKKVALPLFDFNYTLGKVDHHDSDDDVLSLVKLIKPDLSYPVPKVNFFNSAELNKPITLAIVGGSFNESLIKIFQKNKTFSKIYFYFYMNTQKIFTAEKSAADVSNVDSIVIKALPKILSADVVMLEENSSLTVSAHGEKFYAAMEEAKLLV
jgi:hypothetical protein